MKQMTRSNVNIRRSRGVLAGAGVTAATVLFAVGTADGELTTNGSFATSTAGQLTKGGTLTGWTGGGKEGNFGSSTTPPVFVFNPGTSDQLTNTGVTGDSYFGTIKFVSATTAAPDSGVIVAANGTTGYAGAISQTITGLTVGTSYTLTFNWAGAEQLQSSPAGTTTESWKVNFGATSQSTPTLTTADGGFDGWQAASMAFTADGTSDLLKFTAVGGPTTGGDWSLLDNVSLVPTSSVPEPSALGILGLGGLGLLRRRRGR